VRTFGRREHSSTVVGCPGKVLRSTGVAAVMSGGVVLGVVVWRFQTYTDEGAALQSSDPVWAIVGVALLSAAIGIAILRVARRTEPRPTVWWVIVASCGLGLVVLAPLALVSWYPTGQRATLVAYDTPTGTVRWQSTTPATQLFAITRTANELALVGRVDDECDSGWSPIRIDPGTGQTLGMTRGGDGQGPYVPGGPPGFPPQEATGLRWDSATGRIVSEHGWSIQAGPADGQVPALVTPDVVYIAEQGRDYLSCSD
jgi:hypothetical protein